VLTDAGYTYDGDKLIGKDGAQVSFTLQDPSGWNDYITSLQLIADSAKSIGIDAKVETPNADAWTENLNVGDFDAALHWTNAGVTPWEMYSNMFDPAYYAPLGEKASWNYGRYQNPDAAAQFTAYTDATDDAGRKTALDALQKIYVDEVPVIAVDARPAGAEYSTKFWTGWPSDDDAYANPQPTVANAAWILTKLKPAGS
jgi:peptide/nickel transport system substrate-binding protein